MSPDTDPFDADRNYYDTYDRDQVCAIMSVRSRHWHCLRTHTALLCSTAAMSCRPSKSSTSRTSRGSVSQGFSQNMEYEGEKKYEVKIWRMDMRCRPAARGSGG